jgi:hypothetical protein
MTPRKSTPVRGLVAIAALAALSIFATAADAGNGHGHGKRKKNKHRQVRWEQRWEKPRHVVIRRPSRVYVAHAPRYVTYRPQRVVVVRPEPFVRVGGRIGSVHIGAIFGPRRQYSHYDYGCNFCDARFESFSRYDSHVHGCSHRPRNVVIQARVWDDAGYEEWCSTNQRDAGGYYDDARYDDRYDARYDDRYDDRYDRRDDWND